MIHTEIAEELGRTGLSITPNFFAGQHLLDLQDDLDTLYGEGKFQNAGVGHGGGNQVSSVIRQNEMHWIDRESPTLAQGHLWLELDLLKQAFNRTLFLGLNDFEGQYTSYPDGGHYGRHLDSFKASPSRVVSIVLYLNSQWQEGDGGELRIFEGQTQMHQDINPIGGTLICFMSRESEHEVLITHRERRSFTGWFKQNAPRV